MTNFTEVLSLEINASDRWSEFKEIALNQTQDEVITSQNGRQLK